MEGERIKLRFKKEIIMDKEYIKKIKKYTKCSYNSYLVYMENKFLNIPISILIETDYPISNQKTIYIVPYNTPYNKRLTVRLKMEIIKQYIKIYPTEKIAVNSNCECLKRLLIKNGFMHSGTIYKNLYYYENNKEMIS